MANWGRGAVFPMWLVFLLGAGPFERQPRREAGLGDEADLVLDRQCEYDRTGPCKYKGRWLPERAIITAAIPAHTRKRPRSPYKKAPVLAISAISIHPSEKTGEAYDAKRYPDMNRSRR